VTSRKATPSWRLADSVAPLTQALVVTGFAALPTGRVLFLQFQWADGARRTGWLDKLSSVAPVTSAEPPDKSDPDAQTRAAALAFSWTGLQRTGLPDTSLASFSRAFREGMFQEDRLRRLGDRRNRAWLETVIDGGPRWSANVPLREAPGLSGAYDVPHDGPPEERIETPVTVHALLLLYARDDATADAWAAQVEAVLAADECSVSVVYKLDLVLDVENARFSREHFGFADALSQPAPYDDDGTVVINGAPAKKDPVQGVPLGEFLIGYVDGHHEKAPGPVVPGEQDAGSGRIVRAADAGLRPHPQAEGFYDLGVNGSYLVVRELKQDVAAFWRSMDANVNRIREQNPDHSSNVTADWLAERVIGRDRDGHLLCPGGKLPSDSMGQPDSSYLFYDRDLQGVGSPAPGSHSRRAFPRDALAPTADQKETLLQAANNHRILRRGRKFGPKIADYRTDDHVDRGLLFMCLNTDIDRQFEFVQQTWLLNSSFATLFEEVDPLVGQKGRMTIRDEALRRTAYVDTFVKMAGGDYFFLPSLPTLRYLASL
jgi:deferrochelatase/peroxidase EfeB